MIFCDPFPLMIVERYENICMLYNSVELVFTKFLWDYKYQGGTLKGYKGLYVI